MRTARNAIALGVMQLSNVLVALILTPYITRIFGTTLLGVNSFGLSVATNFSIFGLFGIQLYGLREVARVRETPALLQRVFARSLTFQAFFSSLALLGYLIWVGTTTDGYAFYYLLFVIFLLSSATDLTWFYGGFERFDRVALRTLFMRLGGAGLVFWWVERAEQLALLIVLQQGAQLLSNVFYWLPLSRFGVRVSWASLRETLRAMFRPSLGVFLPILLTTLLLTLDRILLGYLSTKEEVALYDYSARLLRIAVIMVSVLGNVLLPRYALLWKKGEREAFQSMLRQQQTYSLLAAGLAGGGLFTIAAPFCSLLLSEAFVGAADILQAMIFTVTLTGLSFYHAAMAIGRERRVLYALLLASAVNFGANWFLIPLWGAWGAALSYNLTEVLLQTVYIIILWDVLRFRSLLRDLFLLIPLLFALLYPLSYLQMPSPWATLFLRGAIFAGAYLLGVLLLFRTPRRAIKKLFSCWKKKHVPSA